MSFAGAWVPPNLGDGVSGRQDGGQIEDFRRGQVEFRSGRILNRPSISQKIERTSPSDTEFKGET